MKKFYLIVLSCLIGINYAVQAGIVPGTEVALSSPNNQLNFRFYQQSENGVPVLYYEVTYKDQPFIHPSRMGIEMDNRVWESALAYTNKVEKVNSWCDNLVFQEAIYAGNNETWKPVYGERSTVVDHYKSAVISFAKPDQSNYRMSIEVRAYNEGIAFRYTFPMHPDAVYNKIIGDLTEYTLPESTQTWCTKWAQGYYEKLTLPEWEKDIPYERALTFQLPNGTWGALTDADVSNWCLLNFVRSDNKPNTIATQMYENIDMLTPYATPWKIIMAADFPGKLLENNDIVLNLNPPCEIADTSWIKPGKIMRETTLTTENALACIDFCHLHNMQYILFDWKWYGPAFDYASDASQVLAPIDMKKIVTYGKEKGVGVWVYVNHHALEKQARKLFPIFKEWGLAGVKFGFVQFKTHRWATWVHDMVRLAADHNLLVNIHDEFRPSGFSRTYPNLLTQEGIRGNEEFPDATHHTVLPFSRMLSGAGDYTICYYDKRLKTTHAHQLAASLIYYSPLQTLFWYDKPSSYNREPEIEFFANLPTVFDDTKVLSGEPGKSVVLARRKDNDWFVGGITNNNGSLESVSLDFLDKETPYLAHIYTDGGAAVKTATQVKCTHLKVDATQTMRFNLKPSGGVAIQFIPMTEKKLKGYKKYSNQML